MAGVEDETRVGPGRMASPEYGPDYAEAFDDGSQWRGASAWDQALTETKPFFVTSEFLGTLAVLVALAVTAGSSDSFGAEAAWPLAVAVVAAFVFGRGFAKAGSASRSWDPRETPGPWWARGDSHEEEETREMSTVSRDEYATQPRGPMVGPRYGYGSAGLRQPMPIETKPFFLTSEFWGTVALIAGLAIAAGTSESIDARLFWTLATGVTAAYILSRGIAKSGTKSRSWDPREDLMQGARERMTNQGA